MKDSIYKSKASQDILMSLYDKKLAALDISFTTQDIHTTYGNTHVIITGNATGKPLVVFHGINAGSPLAIEAIKALGDEYCIYAIDTIGQATKSAPTRVNIYDDSFAKWVADVMQGLQLITAAFIGISYGAFILQNVMKHRPQLIEKAIMVVPGGLVNGNAWASLTQLSFPLIRFLISKKDADLERFLDAFYDEKDEYALTMQRHTLLGVKMDYRRPPLLQSADVKNFKAPVYAIFSDTDVFFPGDKALERCHTIFPNFAGYLVLKGTKHIPGRGTFPLIEKQIRKWMME